MPDETAPTPAPEVESSPAPKDLRAELEADLKSEFNANLSAAGSLNESIVEDAALEWFRLRQGCGEQVMKLGYAVGHGPHLAPSEPAAERDSFGEVVQSRSALTHTRPLPRGEEAQATIREFRRVHIKRRLNP